MATDRGQARIAIRQFVLRQVPLEAQPYWSRLLDEAFLGYEKEEVSDGE